MSEAKCQLKFSNNNLSLIFHIFDYWNTTPNFQLKKILDCSIKSRKCIKVERKKNFTSLCCLGYGPKKNRAPKYCFRKSFLQDELYSGKFLPMVRDRINSRPLRNGLCRLNLCRKLTKRDFVCCMWIT